MPSSRWARRRSRRRSGYASAPPRARTVMCGPGLIEAILSFAKGEVETSRTHSTCVRATERRYTEVPAGAERSLQSIARDGMYDVNNWSGREDLNLRPPPPQGGALPGCATPRWNCYRRRGTVHRGRTSYPRILAGETESGFAGTEKRQHILKLLDELVNNGGTLIGIAQVILDHEFVARAADGEAINV